MSKSNYSSHHSSSRSYRSPSRSERSTSRSQGSTSRVSESHRLHLHNSTDSPDPSRINSSQYSTTNGNEEKQHQQYSSTKTINKLKHNGQLHETYSTFHVHSSNYEVVFVNNNISINMMNKLVNHVNKCNQYSIDTESERTNNQLSLIQINSIPIEPPSIVILFELKHLPDQNSQMYENILGLFHLIFRLGNEIYSWGYMQKELEPAKELLIWPIPATLIDIQPHFSGWYNWARSQCRGEGLSYRKDMNNDNEIMQQHHHQIQSCSCHPPSPYKINELLSLQKAFLYVFNLFIDKTCQRGYWSSSLSSSHSSLSYEQQQKMIHYATHDVMAVTFLIRPIMEKWTFNNTKNRMINEIFISFKAIKMPFPPATTSSRKIKNINIQKLANIFKFADSDIEQISSDEEIHLNQLTAPVKINDYQIKNDDDEAQHINQENDVELQIVISNNDNLLDHINDNSMDHINDNKVGSAAVSRLDPVPRIRRRSPQTKNRRNKKHNQQRRKFRYCHAIKRRAYHRFSMHAMRKILRLYKISFIHVKMDKDDLLIGLKNEESKNEAEHNLAIDIFNRTSYFHYRKLFRR